MNTNPKSKKVLCFGDSNTNGTKPDRSGRFDVNERWTGIAQNILGENYYIIEEGLGGRTTNLEHPNPAKPSRNGLEYFKACIESHMPLDILVLMLGTNDLKTVYKRSAEDIKNALGEYLNYLEQYCAARSKTLPKIILVSPPYMNDRAEKFIESMPSPGIYDEGSVKKSKELAEHIEKLANDFKCEFFDSAQITETGEDGCHIDLESHKRLGQALSERINA